MYDHVADSWTDMPDLIDSRYKHQLLAVKNKLFVVKGFSSFENTIEVFDSKFGRFTALKPGPNNYYPSKSFLNGNEIFVFLNGKTKCLCYDIEKNDWSEKECEQILNLQKCICVKVPCLK